MSPAESERRIVTVLFADLVGFTPLVERLDPEDAATVQLELFRRMRETLERHGGEVAKFAGDAVLAVFGGTRTRDDDAERAVLAGLDIAAEAGQVGRDLGLSGHTLQVRVGVNTGEALTHAGGAASDAVVSGDAVNVA